ncbi:MAG: 7-cyano-7-deazaguanine synthase QueC [Deltaproteobacteria bacterium]|nr:7-cyano-7-deazaguanine synthase QueC [Deltaproteobacteria bacterium]
MQATKKPAVILSSGGLDSTTVMAMAKQMGYALYALSFDYGQRHAFELTAAKRVARALGTRQHLVIRTDLTGIGGSALTADIAVPKHRIGGDDDSHEIPITYVPARNTIFLSYALAWAEVLGSADIFLGVNAVDYSGYPDCRPEYLEAYAKMANLATRAGVEGTTRVKIHAPLVHMTKAEIIQQGVQLDLDYGMTHSCYDPDTSGRACGACDSCTLRKKGFEEAGVKDPTQYI